MVLIAGGLNINLSVGAASFDGGGACGNVDAKGIQIIHRESTRQVFYLELILSKHPVEGNAVITREQNFALNRGDSAAIRSIFQQMQVNVALKTGGFHPRSCQPQRRCRAGDVRSGIQIHTASDLQMIAITRRVYGEGPQHEGIFGFVRHCDVAQGCRTGDVGDHGARRVDRTGFCDFPLTQQVQGQTTRLSCTGLDQIPHIGNIQTAIHVHITQHQITGRQSGALLGAQPRIATGIDGQLIAKAMYHVNPIGLRTDGTAHIQVHRTAGDGFPKVTGGG